MAITRGEGSPVRRRDFIDDTGFEYQGESEGALVWFTPQGDRLGHYHYVADLRDPTSLRARFRGIAHHADLGVLEISTCILDHCTAVRTLFKAAQQPTGRTYIGALTLPFRDFSYVFKVQGSEVGITGVRDTLVLAQLMSGGDKARRGPLN